MSMSFRGFHFSGVVSTAIMLLYFLSAASAAEWEGVFQGTLGKSKIIVELNAGMEASTYKGGFSDGSRYSYYPKPRDLNLVLQNATDQIFFKETTAHHYEFEDLPAGDPKITGQWVLKVNDSGATGTWSSPDGKKKLPIKLKRVELLEPPKGRPLTEGESPPYNMLSYTYNRLWFASEVFEPVNKPSVQFGKVALGLEKDSAFGLEMPVFTSFPEARAMLKANSLLRDYYRKSLMDNRDCLNGIPVDQFSKDYQIEYGFEVTYASPTLVSIVESGSVYCGGAHPNNYYSPMTFDLASGVQIGGLYQLDLSPDGFGKILKLSNKDERIAFETFALNHWQEAAKAAGEEGEESCAGSGFMAEQARGEKEFGLSFTAKGLGVQRSDYPTVAANCLFQDFNPTIIPWADLKPFLKDGQTLLVDEVR